MSCIFFSSDIDIYVFNYGVVWCGLRKDKKGYFLFCLV